MPDTIIPELIQFLRQLKCRDGHECYDQNLWLFRLRVLIVNSVPRACDYFRTVYRRQGLGAFGNLVWVHPHIW
jgi:hypothetical protein